MTIVVSKLRPEQGAACNVGRVFFRAPLKAVSPHEVLRTELSPCSVSLGLPMALNTAVQWLVPFLYAREVPYSNLVPEAACLDVGFLWFSAPSGECLYTS